MFSGNGIDCIGLEERSGTGAEGESDLGGAGGYTGLEI